MIRGLLMSSPLRGAIARASNARRRAATLETLLRGACLVHCDRAFNTAVSKGLLLPGERGADERRWLLTELAAYYATLLPGEDIGPAVEVARDIQAACATELLAIIVGHTMREATGPEAWRATRDRLFAAVHGPALRVLIGRLERNQEGWE
jgi:hypothetical protein